MTRKTLRPLACWTVLGCLILALAATVQPGVGAAEEKTPDKTTTKKKEKAQAGKKFHRLPAYYGDVVDDEQRQKIYKIQEEYGPRIDALRAQLKALLEERNEKIEALLTAEQKQQLDAARAKAKAARKARNSEPKKPADSGKSADE